MKFGEIQGGPAKVRAHNSFLFTEGSPITFSEKAIIPKKKSFEFEQFMLRKL